jgi:hypothetical protein
MEVKTFQIVPSNITIDRFRISNISVRPLQNSAVICVELFSNNELLKTSYLEISGQEYIDWGTDSPYLLNWVCTKLNFTMLE